MQGIFISYRRQDAAGYAGRLYDRLAGHFGAERVFMDVEGIEPGVDFVEAIDRAVASCEALIVIIGPNWLATDSARKRRLDDPKDFVHIETAAALARHIRVVPVLVDGAVMPREEELPADLASLARRQAIELTHKHWDATSAELIRTLERVLDGDKAPRAGTVPVSPRSSPATAEASSPAVDMGGARRSWVIGGVLALVAAAVGVYLTLPWGEPDRPVQQAETTAGARQGCAALVRGGEIAGVLCRETACITRGEDRTAGCRKTSRAARREGACAAGGTGCAASDGEARDTSGCEDREIGSGESAGEKCNERACKAGIGEIVSACRRCAIDGTARRSIYRYRGHDITRRSIRLAGNPTAYHASRRSICIARDVATRRRQLGIPDAQQMAHGAATHVYASGDGGIGPRSGADDQRRHESGCDRRPPILHARHSFCRVARPGFLPARVQSLPGGLRWTAERSGDAEGARNARGDSAPNRLVRPGRIRGYESVTVPAGTFKSLKVEIDSNRRPTEGMRSREPVRTMLTLWYAPEVKRVVKMLRVVMSEEGTHLDEDTYELVRYRLQ